jgi:surface antigen
VVWENRATGNGGVVTPTASDYTPDGRPCREIRMDVYVKEGPQAWTVSSACQRPDGTWARRGPEPHMILTTPSVAPDGGGASVSV